MNTTSSTAIPPPSSKRRLARVAYRFAWLGVICWFAWFCYVRISTPPGATALDAPQHPLTVLTLTAAAQQQLNSLQPLPSLISSAPSAWSPWGGWLYDAETLAGRWDPNSSSYQQQLVAHVSGPAVAPILDQLVQLARDKRLVTDSASGGTGASGPFVAIQNPHSQMQAVASLVVRARNQREVHHDVAGAMQDLRTALELARFYRRFAAEYGWPSTKPSELARYELARATFESPLPPEVARETIDYLRRCWGFELREHIGMIFAGANSVDALLDPYYTDDGNGDGWLVLSAMTDIDLLPYLRVRTPRSRVWNVLSPLFHSRATMRERLTNIDSLMRTVEDTDYDRTLEIMRGRDATMTASTPRDGPLMGITRGIPASELQGAYHDLIGTRVMAVQLALAAYRFDHGVYPTSLAALAPDYLLEPPVDALTNSEYVYERPAPDCYELRSQVDIPTELFGDFAVPAFGYRSTSYLPAFPREGNARHE